MIGVGILISNNNNIIESLFSNGLIQNCLNLYDLINSIEGYNPFFVSMASDEDFNSTKKDLKKLNYDIIKASLANLKNKNTKIILEAGSFSDVLFRLTKAKMPEVKFVSVEYGNPLFFNIEYSVFKKDKLFSSPKDRDQVWYSPHFDYSHDFISELSRCGSAKPCPFIWSEKFLLHNINKYNIDTRRFLNQSLNNISILEPNLNLVKTSVVPLLIANKLFKENKNFINSVSAFGCKKLENSSTFNEIIKNTELFRSNKLALLNRYPFVEIFSKVSGLMLSHQHYNSLNYAYLDALYLGVPLVHNSVYFKDVGYYYNDFNISEGKEALKKAISYHRFRSEEEKDKEKEIINNFSIEKNIQEYKYMLEELIS
jgi:hypothetical protein